MRSFLPIALVLCLSVPVCAQQGCPTTTRADDGVGGGGSRISSPSSTAVVLPAAYANQMGQSANTFPHARANMRYQQVFLGSEINRVLAVRQVCLRLDERSGGPAQTQQLELFLGSTKYDYKTLTLSFAGNYNGTLARRSVFKGTVNLPAHSGGGSVNSWGICFPLSAPWIWTNPSSENLIVEFINTSASSKNHFEDFCTGSTTTRAFAGSAQATTAAATANNGLVIRLDDGVIPKPGKYTLFGSGCQGSGQGPCFSNNPNGGTLSSPHNANVFALAVDASTQVTVTGFQLYTQTIGSTPVTLQTQVYLANASGAPTGSPVRTGTMLVTPTAGFHRTTFSPLTVPGNSRFFISYTGGSGTIRFPFLTTGNNGIHYWHSATSSSWNGPVQTQRWSWLVDCSGAPMLTNVGLPELGKSFDIELRVARTKTAALLWFGTRINVSLPGGCALYSSQITPVVVQTDANGYFKLSLKLPNNIALKGGKFANQWWVLDPQGALFNTLALTNGGEGEIGG